MNGIQAMESLCGECRAAHDPAVVGHLENDGAWIPRSQPLGALSGAKAVSAVCGVMTAPAIPLRVTAVIPARGGSKGIPRKNARNLCGKPLVAYSIEAALKSNRINQVVVSSDDDEILSIAAAYPSVLAWKRPPELSHDTANLSQVTSHVEQGLAKAGAAPDVTVVLHPTSPFRNPKLLNFLVDKTISGYSRVISVREMRGHGPWYFSRGQCKPSQAGKMSPTLPLYRAYGLFSAANLAYGMEIYLHKIDDEIQLIDIDYPHQFGLAEEIVRSRLFDFDMV